jgi:acetylornithine deacetylase/succinyl-diaminopimelate desuccinylase-like protein
MSYTDVVAVEPERWTNEPFSGDIADGFLYGRGALDMKQMVAMEAMTMLLLTYQQALMLLNHHKRGRLPP